MPVISRFYGIAIKMYFQKSEHNPPHIHAVYGEYVGAIDIKTLEMIEGDLPRKALNMVTEWIELHQKELMAIWDTQDFIALPPLE
jgi:hypothetical protein